MAYSFLEWAKAGPVRDVTRTLIGEGGVFIYQCSARQISFEFELISKESVEHNTNI